MIDMVGGVYGRLNVIAFSHKNNLHATYWRCKCNCGNEKIVSRGSLISGSVRSCKCLSKEMASKRILERIHPITHGLTYHPLYRKWDSMIQRCSNNNHKKYPRYGGRGILVCKEWRTDFRVFYNWAIINGWAENLQIDRINNDGNYEPTNCRFVTRKVNMKNKSDNTILEYNGKKQCIADWGIEFGLRPNTISTRLHRNWSLDKIFKPV